MRTLIALLAVFSLVSCGVAQPITERLSGTWQNELAVYKVDFINKTMERNALGEVETKSLTILEETEESITFQTDGAPITMILVDDDTARFFQEGKINLDLKRVR